MFVIFYYLFKYLEITITTIIRKPSKDVEGVRESTAKSKKQEPGGNVTQSFRMNCKIILPKAACRS